MTEPINESELYRRAIKLWGVAAQKQMYFEESAELTNAICKHARGRCTRLDVVTEIADVIIMCRQLAQIFGAHDVRAEIRRKLIRLEERLSEKEKHSRPLKDELTTTTQEEID